MLCLLIYNTRYQFLSPVSSFSVFVMAFHHRKLLLPPKPNQFTNTKFVQVNKHDSCSSPCSVNCPSDCNKQSPSDDPPPPPPPPHLPPSPVLPDDSNQISPFLLLMFCIIGGAFLVVCYHIIATKCRSNSTSSRRRNRPSLDDTHEDFIDEHHGPVVNHPIWLINTVGLQQSIIDSIAVFKYKRDEGLIEGTECSVCLNEFQEDESLRLLPKCSHAFHIPCIDSWLSSHKNCPLCRSPIICDSNNAHVITEPPNLPELSSRDDTRVENFESQSGLGNHLVVDGDDNSERGDEDGKIAEILEMNTRHLNARNHEVRVLSDLANHSARVEEELAVVRRSISMDSASASMIYAAVAKIRSMEQEGWSDTRLVVEAKKPNSRKVGKRGKRSNSSIYRVMKSCSFGRSLQNGPVSMKRSFSSSGDSVLPQ